MKCVIQNIMNGIFGNEESLKSLFLNEFMLILLKRFGNGDFVAFR